MEQEFDTLPIKTLVLRLGIPAMFAQFFNILYSVVDRIYVGHIAGYGELALASIGVCAPALSAISAFAFLGGIGGASAMSIALGQRDKETARRMMNSAMLLLVILSLLVTGAALLFRRNFLYLLGCSDSMYPFASQYFTIYVLGTLFVLLGTGMNQFVLAQGFAKEGMLSIIIGALCNVCLDPLLIFVFDLGIAGAAIATILSQLFAMCYVLRALLRRNIPVRLGLGGYEKRAIFRILSIGSMPFFITLLDNLIIIFLNGSLRYYGGPLGDQYIASAAVVQSFMILVEFPSQGIVTGCGTLYSYHYGAGNYDKVMQVFKYVLILCSIYIGILLLVAQLMPGHFAGLFLSDETSRALTASFIRKYTLGFLGIGVQYAFVDGLTAMGKVRYALPISFFRKGLYILCLFLLPRITDLRNIFFAESISDLVGAAFTLLLFFLFIKKRLRREMQPRLLSSP